MTKNLCAFFTMLAGALLLSPAVQAQTWSTVGSSCSPGVDSIGLYYYNVATFEFADGATGQIKTRCQINNPLDKGVPKWTTLSAGFVDPDGLGGNYEVQVELVRVTKATGAYTVILTLDSDQYTTELPQLKSIPLNYTFNFNEYSYYLSLNLSRGDTNHNPGVWFAQLK
jgi:hypothetical protein